MASTGIAHRGSNSPDKASVLELLTELCMYPKADALPWEKDYSSLTNAGQKTHTELPYTEMSERVCTQPQGRAEQGGRAQLQGPGRAGLSPPQDQVSHSSVHASWGNISHFAAFSTSGSTVSMLWPLYSLLYHDCRAPAPC